MTKASMFFKAILLEPSKFPFLEVLCAEVPKRTISSALHTLIANFLASSSRDSRNNKFVMKHIVRNYIDKKTLSLVRKRKDKKINKNEHFICETERHKDMDAVSFLQHKHHVTHV